MNKKILLSLASFSTLTLLSFFNENDRVLAESLQTEPVVSIEGEVTPNNLRKYWVDSRPVYFANGSPPQLLYFTQDGFGGYLTLQGTTDDPGLGGGTNAYYSGYIYPLSGPIPYPSKVTLLIAE